MISLNYFHDGAPMGNFTAYYTDGSGAAVFQIVDGTLYCDGYVACDATNKDIEAYMCDRGYDRWSRLPDDFNFCNFNED